MIKRIDIDHNKLRDDLLKLCKTIGPTQACIRFSKRDPRIDGCFPMEKKVEEIIRSINTELGKERGNLQIIRYMGNLIIIGGIEKIAEGNRESKIIDAEELKKRIINTIKNIPVVFGAHLDEITYTVSKRIDKNLEIWENEEGEIDEEIWEILPLCNPPLRFKVPKYLREDGYVKLTRTELIRPECRIVGYRKREFKTLGLGEISILWIRKDLDQDQEVSSTTNRKTIFGAMGFIEQNRPEEHFYLRIKKDAARSSDIMPGDMVIQDYYVDDENPDTLEIKALDDRVGCISAIYAVKELAKMNICSKAILTSSEEGIPKDISWGRLVQPCYEKFCKKDNITLICDGMDGARMSQFNYYQNGKWRVEDFKDNMKKELMEQAVVIPFTADGKGGGDLGIFSMLRDEILPELIDIYHPKNVAVTSTDYSGRSYEVKIMDKWGLIGFVQWTCGFPKHPECVCHNKETVHISQVVNIIRTMVQFASRIADLRKKEAATS